ncbi:2-oxoglutaramate amidase [Vibrio aerogenes CECT 7868]|uniref:2-oxoglutaramate amidase n=1 Tax=Vibrio aerogenes CECT 7868 TaxID=1216006 RepID=A0A1M5YX99_9VIBR|nr:carbon-nitrogen hydrolase family protein [Vibrio aerogenes]SHI16494.1 2-oxoglutaramate amidase [Vibrio aerogenes CECT 7868]
MTGVTFKAAAIQMNSGDHLDQNLQQAASLIAEAASQGAELVVLPEYFYWMGEDETTRIRLGEPFGDGPLQRFLSRQAQQYQVWLSGGTIPLQSTHPQKVFNSNLLFSPSGACAGRYDKIHLFGFDNGNECYQESEILEAGHDIQTFTTPFGLIRPSVCYDLRFPEMFRDHSGYSLITAPAAFTAITGLAHWEILLRARAVENQCFVIAAAQTGEHPGGKSTFGHSMIIDPWGKVLACLEEGYGIVCAQTDMDYMQQVRGNLPALRHQRLNTL